MIEKAAGVMLLVAALSTNAFADSDFEFNGYLRAGAVYNQDLNVINTGLFEPDSGDVNKIGSIAWQTTHGKQLAEFKSGLIKKFGYDRIQFVTISRPSAYGEYEP